MENSFCKAQKITSIISPSVLKIRFHIYIALEPIPCTQYVFNKYLRNKYMNETDFLHWGTHVYTHMYMKPKLTHLLLISSYSNK